MPNRRRFMQAAAALSAAPAVGTAARAGQTGRAADLVIYDERYAPARAFGRAAMRQGASVRRIGGDVTALWYGELYEKWRAAPFALAGMTDRMALFCLEELARDARMRVVHRTAHPHAEDDAPIWAAEAAQTLLSAPLPGHAAPTPALAESAADERTLYSWIIAPAAARARSV